MTFTVRSIYRGRLFYGNLDSECEFHVCLPQYSGALADCRMLLWGHSLHCWSLLRCLKHCLAAVKFLQRPPKLDSKAAAASTSQRGENTNKRGEALYFLSKTFPPLSYRVIEEWKKSLSLKKTSLFLRHFQFLSQILQIKIDLLCKFIWASGHPLPYFNFHLLLPFEWCSKH